MHGKPPEVVVVAEPGGVSSMLQGVPSTFTVARYHSLYAKRPLPDCLVETMRVCDPESRGPEPNDGDSPVIMAIAHKTLPVAAVQFHPESILTSPDIGMQLLVNALKMSVVG